MERVYKQYDIAYIYVLIDPRDNRIRYVGKTVNCYRRRFMHLEPANLKNKSHKNSWIKNLKNENLKPIFHVIEEVPIENWQERERYWIKYYKDLGCDLTNDTDGGDGGTGSPKKGRKTPEDVKKKMSDAQKIAQNKRIAEGNYGSWLVKLKRKNTIINVTQAELEKIELTKNIEKRYLLLELLVFSKMMFISGKTEEYEVSNNYAKRIRFASKIKAELKDIEFWYYDFCKNGLLLSDGIVTKILFVNEGSSVIFTLGEDGQYCNIIKKYTDFLGYIPKNCEKCGEIIKVGSNRQKFCDICRTEENRRKSREYVWGKRHPEFDPDL